MTDFETYLHTSYEPEMEFVGGKLVERHVGEMVHSFAQGLIAAELGKQERLAYRTFLALRVRLSDEPRIRVPDVCVIARPHRVAPIMTSPHLVVEVLGTDDRTGPFLEKLADYQAAGIPHIWVVDPYSRTLFDCSGGRMSQPASERLETPLVGEVDFAPLFAEIAELTTPASRSPRP